MKQFGLINRPDYKVVVSEVGSRLRTLILPFTQIYPNGMEYTLDCKEGSLVTEQKWGDQVARSSFLLESGQVVVQKGEILSFSECLDCAPEKIPFEIVCVQEGF